MSDPFSAPFNAATFIGGLSLLDRLYLLSVTSAVVGSAVTCAQVVVATKRNGDRAELDARLNIEKRIRRLSAMFNFALLASAAFVINGVLTTCLWYMVLRQPADGIASVLRFYWWMTQTFVLSLLAMEAMKWIASNATARIRQPS